MTKTQTTAIDKKIAKMSFEEAMARLEEVVEILSSPKIDLNQMIELYQEGNQLKTHCLSRLQEAKMKIDVINEQEKLEEIKDSEVK